MGKFTANEAQIKKWKTEHGKAIEITVWEKPNKKGEKYRCFIGDPLGDLNLFSAGMDEQSIMTRKIFFLDNLWIDGDKEFKDNPKVRIAGAIRAYEMIEILDSEGKKH
jgi:hypothetical protein